MSVMAASRVWPITDRPLTVADLDDTPDDGLRYELDDGVLVVSPAPIVIHQLVLQRLQMALGAACPEDYLVLPGPGLEMSEVQYRIPDLVVVRADFLAASDKSVTRPPDLVIEIASASTARYDRNRKKVVYAEFGIPAYWIVVPDPDRPSITEYRLDGAAYREAGTVAGGDPFATDFPFPVRIIPAELVAGRWRQ